MIILSNKRILFLNFIWKKGILLSLIKRYFRTYFKFIFLFILLISIVAGLEFVLPWIIRNLLSQIEMNTLSTMSEDILKYFIIFTLLSLFKILHMVIRLKFGKVFTINESKYLYYNLFNMNFKHFSKNDPTYFSNRINESIGVLGQMIGASLPKTAIAVLILCISLVIVYQVNVYLFLLFLLLIPLNFYAYKHLNRMLMEKSKEAQVVYAENDKNILGVVQNIEHIKQTYQYQLFANLIGDYNEASEKKGMALNAVATIGSNIIEYVIGFLKNGILFLSIYLYFRHKIEFADIIFVNMILGIYSMYLSELSGMNLSLRDVKVALSFIKEDVLDCHEQASGCQVLAHIENVSFHIQQFQYGDKVILRDLDFHIGKNETLGIVGKSGCGKSTLIRLLIRLYDTEQILINGIDIKSYSLSSLRKKVYLIAQNISLFPGSIRENITIGFENYDDTRLDHVLSLPFMKYFDQFDQGIDTPVQERGLNLSGGEKQRIAIARMLMSEAELIIFDESTASLDPQTEREIFRDIEPLCKDKTYVIISHRLEIIKTCDHIVLLEGGKIKSEGNFDDLKQRAESFNALFSVEPESPPAV